MDVIRPGQIVTFDERGNQNIRTPLTHPYNYDPFVVWFNPSSLKSNASFYTDRCRAWDRPLYESLMKELFADKGHYWSEYEPEAVQMFVRRFLHCDGLDVEKLVEHCHVSNGYPCWQILYYDPRK
jgi:hypothetical protein